MDNKSGVSGQFSFKSAESLLILIELVTGSKQMCGGGYPAGWAL